MHYAFFSPMIRDLVLDCAVRPERHASQNQTFESLKACFFCAGTA